MKDGTDPQGTKKADRDRFIRCYPVLKELPPDLLRKVDARARLVQAPAGRRLFDEGSPCTDYPLLVEGIIRASKFGPDGHEILLYRLNPGESCVITVVALLGATPYPAVGTAETRLTLLGIPRNLFVELVLKSAAFRTFVFQSLSQRMARLMALIDDVAFRRVDQRLASRLLRHREPITATHQMLADELGTTREVVSRTLESFQESGMLRLGRKRIEILDRPGLDRVHRPETQ
ncbi:MAG TPA: Crp/Fnr family transcriptional regulator [Candidatus Polarisedimenticolia bacterium]|jgi:CRP/FNR family transcriptional regulator|nr:Crp/Fnr family transcriptional regulator [Candidatus Polarisedimenticolia bacterium]